MALIKPITTFFNGESIEVNNFDLRSIGDNLSLIPTQGQATLYYQLQKVSIVDEVKSVETVITANLEISGTDYDSWNADPTSNAWILQWAAAKLNLVLITE